MDEVRHERLGSFFIPSLTVVLFRLQETVVSLFHLTSRRQIDVLVVFWFSISTELDWTSGLD